MITSARRPTTQIRHQGQVTIVGSVFAPPLYSSFVVDFVIVTFYSQLVLWFMFHMYFCCVVAIIIV